MKGTRRSKVWLALGLVAMACLVLAGCPHNNLLDSSGGGGVGNGGGSRGGSDGVQLVITNFVSEEGAAKRSASWLGGPQKTIVPEHIDLKDAATIEKYVFVAQGKGGGNYGPEFINVQDGTGLASLNISGSGTWEITVEAYEVSILVQNAGTNQVVGADKNTIMTTQDNAAKVITDNEALVLRGKATVDLRGGSQVTMTLTGDGVGTEGNVKLDISLKTANDKTEIQTKNYDVSVGLYDFVTGDLVGVGSKIYTAGSGVVADPLVYTENDIPKGRYQFRLVVTNPADADKAIAYYVDDIWVEGNRTTDFDVNVYNLFNTPTPPVDVKVSYSRGRAGDSKDGYLSYITWSGMSYNAVGMDIEIADITQWYSYNRQHKVDFDGPLAAVYTEVDITNGQALWTEIDKLNDGTTPKKEDVVKTLSWKDSPQTATTYPAIWMAGSLMNGSSGVTFLMQSGHIYSVRIKAAGAQSDSSWLIYGAGDGSATIPLNNISGGTPPIEFTKTKTNGLFDLIQVTYELEGKYKLYQTKDARTIGNAATAEQLLLYHEYDPVTPYPVSMKYNQMDVPQIDDWFLYSRDNATLLDDRIKTWTGWQNKYVSTQRFVAGTWGEYSDYVNLYLTPIGAGGSVAVQAQTAGTFNVLDETNVLIALEADGAPTVATAGWQELGNGDTNPAGGGTDVKNRDLGLQADAANNRYILNLDRGGTNKTFLYIAVGKTQTPTDVGTLIDENGADFVVRDIVVSLKQGLDDIVVFDSISASAVKKEMNGVGSGDYTLYVKILADSGYWQTYQVPIVVKYNDQVIP